MQRVSSKDRDAKDITMNSSQPSLNIAPVVGVTKVRI